MTRTRVVALSHLLILGGCVLYSGENLILHDVQRGADFQTADEPRATIHTLRVFFEVKPNIKADYSQSVAFYRCGYDWREYALSSDLPHMAASGYFYADLPASRASSSSTLPSYDLGETAFDVCMVLVQSDYPNVLKSSELVIPTNEVVRKLNSG